MLAEDIISIDKITMVDAAATQNAILKDIAYQNIS
jgi:hypothetical protein